MANILILVGTESGNAQMVADYLDEVLTKIGHNIEIISEEAEAAAIDFPDREVVLICTSTHGDGELPDCLIPLYESLKADQPDLSNIRYGVIALGDQTYSQTFCQAGKDMDKIFATCGAQKVGERLEIDACTQPLPDEDAATWAKEWVTLL